MRANDPRYGPATGFLAGLAKRVAAQAVANDPLSGAAWRGILGSLANLQPSAAPLSALWDTAARSFVGGAANLPSASPDLRESASFPSGPANQAESVPPSFARLSWISAPTDARGASNYLGTNGLDDDQQIAPHLARDPSNRADLIGDASARDPAPSTPFGTTSPEPDPVRTAQADIQGSVGTLNAVLRQAVIAGRLTEEEAAILQQRANAVGVARGEKVQAAVRARQGASSPPTSGEAATGPQPSSAPSAPGTAAPIPKAVGEEPGPARATEEPNPTDTGGLVEFLEGLFKKMGPGPYAPPNGGVRLARPYGRPRAAERAQNNANGAKFGCHTCGRKDFGTKSGNPVLDHQPAQSLNQSPGASAQGYPHCVWCSSEQGTVISRILRALGVL